MEQIRRSPTGRITAYWFKDGTPGAAVIDPATGRGVGSADPSKTELWLTSLHRSLFLGDNGRIAMAAGAVAMLILAFSGAVLVVRRVGGWRRWFRRLNGPLAGRIHTEIARVVVLGLGLSALTALWMVANTFEVLPSAEVMAEFPTEVSGKMGIALNDVAILADTPLDAFRELNFPYAGDAGDVYTLTTDAGTGYIDQGNGAELVWAKPTIWARIFETVYMLHTGQGAVVLGLVLGLMALGVPLMGVTGTLVWLSGRRGRKRIRANHPANRAETIVLVGSESGSTWGFASTLHAALNAAGYSVHTGPMSAFDPTRYACAKRLIVLAATHGDGDAPAQAAGFLEKFSKFDPLKNVPVAVLGFGDRSFSRYCAFAQDVSTRAQEKGWQELIPFDTVDRQSPQDFARWGLGLGQALGIELTLAHQPVLPKTQVLKLVSRRDYGVEVQAPTAILRFALPKAPFWHRFTRRFQAGDLLGIIPEGSAVPRLYSLASARKDGFIEIVVKKHPGGLCSGQMMALEPGDSV